MSEELQQAVVDETKAPAEPGAEVENARETTDDLDTLLKQFEQTEAKPPETPKPEHAGADDSKLLEPIKGTVSAIEQRLFRQDMDETVKKVRGDLDPEFFDDDFVESWLDAQARNDRRLQQAWVERHNNPRQFQKVIEGLSRGFAKKYGKLPDKGATEDREAVTAAVRGASTKAPEGKAPDYSNMSNAEFREAHKKEYGYYPPV